MPTINHPIQPEELMAYLDGELPLERANSTAEHLESCRECQGVAADLQSVSRRLMDWQVEATSSKAPEIFESALVQPKRKPRRSRWVLGFAAVSVVVLILSMALPRVKSSRYASAQYQWLSQFDRLEKTPQQKIDSVRPSESVRTDSVQMIARTAQLALTTQEFDKARAALEDILKRHNGYLGQLNVNAPSGYGRTLDATLRIPADQRDAALAEIKKLGRVEAESQTGEEVTSQYADLEARLSNARNTEQRLAAMLRERTGKLSDVLAVEQEISRVRGEIEQMEAQKKALTNRVEFLTLEVKLTEDYRAQIQLAPDSTLGRFRNAAISGYKSMAGGVVGLILLVLAYGPSLLLAAVLLFFPLRFVWRKFRRN